MRMLALSLLGILVASNEPDIRPAPVARDTTVTIKTFQYRPGSLVVPVGTRVVWSNGDGIEHTISAGIPDSSAGTFNGVLQFLGATFAQVFNRPGTYSYFCNRHQFMRGEIRVTSTGEN
jgi:plastocyanin